MTHETRKAHCKKESCLGSVDVSQNQRPQNQSTQRYDAIARTARCAAAIAPSMCPGEFLAVSVDTQCTLPWLQGFW